MGTIKDVAKMAGVSTSTVSRALSGKIPVDEKTKQKVMAAVKELNYQPNALAKSLKEGTTNTIALIIPNIRNAVFPAVARGVEDIARKHGFTVILCNTDEDLTIEKEYVDKLKKRWVDGFVFATAVNNEDHILALKDAGFPVILLVRHLDAKIDAVISDNFKASYEAVSYLVKRGHKKIAIISNKLELSLYKNRLEGYKKALQEADLPIDEELIITSLSDEDNAYEPMLKMLQSGIDVDAVFAMSDYKAAGVIRAIKDFGLSVPEDISVIGYGNTEMSPLLDPPLTTISQPFYEMGANATTKLIKLIKNKNKSQKSDEKPVIDILESKLIIRSSTR